MDWKSHRTAWGECMQIGVPKETALYENRIAITPDTIKKFIKLGHSIVV